MTATGVRWNPADYAVNSASQLRWARELIGRLQLKGDESVLDVGCGDGKVTAELARAVPRGRVLGIDASAEMIGYARQSFAPGAIPNLEFCVMDARRIEVDRPFDILFSNAALHWVDDHPAFLRGASASLAPGGRLVVSCGGKGNAHDVFVALRALMRQSQWREFFRKMEAPYYFHRPGDYEKWLPRCGFGSGRVRLVEKDMAFAERAGFAGWIRTTWLPYTQRVPETMREQFVTALVDQFLSRHHVDESGSVHVGMVRLEIDAVKTTNLTRP